MSAEHLFLVPVISGAEMEDRYKSVVVTAIDGNVPGVKTFALTYADGRLIPYRSGQFITLVFTHHGKEERRSFSISSSAAAGEPLAITVKRIDNGAYSRYLTDKVMPGDVLTTTGVAGLFTLPGVEVPERVLFFAAGIGITPVFSLIKEALATTLKTKVVLVYSNRSRADTAFAEELDSLTSSSDGRFVIVYLYSDAPNLERARLNKALVRTLLNEYAQQERDKTLFYICGPYDYMRMVIYALEENGVKDEQIRRENFNMNAKSTVVAEPPDKEPHNITFLHNGVATTITVQYPETILKAAKRNNIPLPYSCEVGRCGSCALLCTKGKVWHSYNEVLMDMDLRHGSILTCTGYAVGGDVTIEV